MTEKIDRHTLRLYKAVANYVEKKGGRVAVTGGIEIQEWPEDRKMNFRVAVRCTGRKPVYRTAEIPTQAIKVKPLKTP